MAFSVPSTAALSLEPYPCSSAPCSPFNQHAHMDGNLRGVLNAAEAPASKRPAASANYDNCPVEKRARLLSSGCDVAPVANQSSIEPLNHLYLQWSATSPSTSTNNWRPSPSPPCAPAVSAVLPSRSSVPNWTVRPHSRQHGQQPCAALRFQANACYDSSSSASCSIGYDGGTFTAAAACFDVGQAAPFAVTATTTFPYRGTGAGTAAAAATAEVTVPAVRLTPASLQALMQQSECSLRATLYERELQFLQHQTQQPMPPPQWLLSHQTSQAASWHRRLSDVATHDHHSFNLGNANVSTSSSISCNNCYNRLYNASGPSSLLAGLDADVPRERILFVCRAAGLSADTTARLATHVWNRIEGMVRLLASVRQAGVSSDSRGCAADCGGGAGGEAAALQIHAVAVVWVAAKLEERRAELPSSRMLAVAARTTPAVLAAAEVRVLQWCEWAPYAGFVPDESHLLSWGP